MSTKQEARNIEKKMIEILQASELGKLYSFNFAGGTLRETGVTLKIDVVSKDTKVQEQISETVAKHAKSYGLNMKFKARNGKEYEIVDFNANRYKNPFTVKDVATGKLYRGSVDWIKFEQSVSA